MNEIPAGTWTVDLASNLASCGDFVVRFSEAEGDRLNIAFVGAPPCSLEDQCRIAGEASMAIRLQRP